MVESNARLPEGLSVLRGLLDQIPAMIWTTNPDLQLTSVQGGAARDLGLTMESPSGDIYGFFDTLDPEFLPIRAHRKALLGESAQYEFEFKDVWAQCHVQPIHDDRGRVSGVIGVAVDITARKQAERERQELIEQLEQSLHEVEALRQRLKICAKCRRVQDCAGDWRALDEYLCSHHSTIFSHGFCEACMKGASFESD